MKKIMLPVAAALVVLGLAGCASSERMARMSGGVFDEYSVPKSQRLRSEKFQKKTENFAGVKRSGGATVGFRENLVNIWPFFFRSDDYVSIFWPFIDFDPYGMAIRPFYNHEGDDYSILFPLSAWNTADKSGWVLTGWWNRHSAAFLPLFYHSTFPVAGTTWILPFFYHSSSRQSGTTWILPLYYHSWDRPKQRDFRMVLLGYYGKAVGVDDSEWAWLFRRGDDDGVRRELAYRFGKEGKAVPKNDKELEKLRVEVHNSLPESKETKVGFLPLFHVTEGKDAWSFNLVGPFFWLEREGEAKKGGVLGPVLGWRQSEPLGPVVGGAFGGAESSFTSFALLSRFSKTTYYQWTPEVQALHDLTALSRRTPFERYRPEMETMLRTIDPAQKLPATVTDANTMRLFLEDLTRGREFPTRHEYSGGFLPLYCYSFREKSDWWAIPAALTWRRSGVDWSTFWSLPLFTYAGRSPTTDVTTVAGPVVWYSKTRRVEWEEKKIHSRDILWAEEYNLVEFESDYAALGLYHHGRDAFLVAREGVDARAAEKVRSLLWELFRERGAVEREREAIDKRETRNRAWKPNTRLEELRQLTEEEEIRLARLKFKEREAKYQDSEADLKRSCARVGFAYSPDVFASREAVCAEVGRLQKAVAELRWVEDYGNGIFYRKRIFCNGDYNWRLLGGYLAGGETSADKEDTHVLHLLYRYRREGKRSEELIFPFISVEKDGDDSRFSFLWRVFERQEKSGKTGGHFLFIPYGEL